MSLSISFEFFPPNTPVGVEKLRETRASLARFSPEFFSVTYGAGGANQAKTFDTVLEIRGEGREVAPHLSCIGASAQSVAELLERYREAGIGRLVALRGDLPSGMGTGLGGEFRHASDLVRFVRERHGDAFRIEVAAYPEMHPQARSPVDDLRAFVTKVKAGADAAITQYFFNADAYFRFCDEAVRAGVDVPIVPGIMPITNYAQIARFSDACGAEIPRWIRSRLVGFGDDMASLRAFGHDVVADLLRRLVEGGAPGVHFYTLNQAGPTAALCETLSARIR